jgi:hypothetical protein
MRERNLILDVTSLVLGKQIIEEMKAIARIKEFQSIVFESTMISKAFYEKQGAI